MAKNLMSVFGAPGGKGGGSEGGGGGGGSDGPTLPPHGPGPQSRSVMVLGKTLTFKGELAADEDLLLMGRVEGTITHSSSVTVGMGGVVIGDIKARNITIKGTVDGDLEASESISVTPTANVLGDLTAPRVGIVEGARFVGAVKMTTISVTASADAPAGDQVADRILES